MCADGVSLGGPLGDGQSAAEVGRPMTDIHAHRILILDFGSQYTQLIARRVRELGVFSEIRAFDMTDEEIREYNPKGIILAGGPESVPEEGSPRAPQAVYELGVPVLGICYGMQAVAEQLGEGCPDRSSLGIVVDRPPVADDRSVDLLERSRLEPAELFVELCELPGLAVGMLIDEARQR